MNALADHARRSGLSLGLIAFVVCVGAARPGAAPRDASSTAGADAAAVYFDEARALSARDGGRLWGVELYGPILFADPVSRAVFANQADDRGLLAPRGTVFVGVLPADVNVANTALEWAGVRWTMVRLPLPKARERRLALLAHELFHRVQPSLGIPLANPSNAHLDSLEGRYLLQLEWRALRRALSGSGRDRARAVSDALAFRERRRAIFAGAAVEESSLELNEGLAEYTGCALAPETAEARTAAAIRALEAAAAAPSYARSFAYGSGPAYGLLLDARDERWRSALDASSDLGRLLARAYGVRAAGASARDVERRALRYDGAALRSAEIRREEERLARERLDRERFAEAPVLELELTPAMRISFDPGELRPVGELGTLYPTARMSDAWGVATVTNGMLLAGDWRTARLPAPGRLEERPLRGDGWTLDLAEGWEIVPATRPGSFRLRKEPPNGINRLRDGQ